MTKPTIVCPQCRRVARPIPNTPDTSKAVRLYFILACPWIPDEINPLGIGGRVLCPMAAAR